MKRNMKKFFHRVIATACASFMVLGSILSDVGTLKVEAAGEHTVWVVGDSTVSAFSDDYYYPRYGYGTQIGNYLNDTYTVQNLAVSGTSSLSFTQHANYSTLVSGIKEGDTLVVGFGHNDEKAEDAERYTSPVGDYTTEGSFAKSLYDNYITMAQNAGAEVILCTPIVRRTATTGSWSESQLHVTNGGDYAQAVRDLGANENVNVPVVDLTTLTKDLYDSLGAEETVNLHAWTKNDAGSVDNTHLNIYGAKKVAWMFANAVANTSATLASAIDLSAGEPTKEADLVSNPDYVEIDYDNDLAQSALWADYVVGEGESAVAFKGTAFGYLGGNPSTSNYVFETDASGNMHLVSKNNKGKITGSADGLIMYYYKVPVGSSFSLSAKATVNAFDANQQVAFGLMARDDMYIDLNDTTIASDYVAAGTLGTGCNCFYRKAGALGGKAALTTETLAAGSSYNLSIVSNSDGYTCTFGNEPAQSAGYDFALTSVDSEYVYIGMFVARNADVTYSNIHLVVDGQTIVDTRKTEYNVSVSSDENGSAKASASSAAAGATVNLTAIPNAGYYLKEWQVVSGEVTVENNSFVMPASDVEIQAVFEAYPTSWDFKNDSSLLGADNGIVIQGSTGTFAGLTIDASASGAKFDTLNRSSYAQVNNGTIITVPVEGSSKVTVTAYNGANFTVDGQAAISVSETFTCEGKDNKVTIEFTAHEYLTSIKVEPYAEVEAGTINFASAAPTDSWAGISLNNIAGINNSHGIYTSADGATMTLTLSDKANVIVTTCRYGAGLNGTMTASSGTVSTAEVDEAGANAPVFTVKEANAGELTLTFASNMYIHSVMVEYVIEVGPRNIDVWDLGGKLESDTETYTNNITPDGYIAAGVNKTFPGTVVFGDMTVTANAASDRLYTTVDALSSISYGTFGATTKDYGDGYTSAGCFYTNGTGGANRRHLTIANVQAGDKIVVYGGIHGGSDTQFIFEGLGTASSQKEMVDIASGTYQKFEFVAEHTGTYKIWENALGKALFHRVLRVPAVEVSGAISCAEGDNKYTGTGHSVKFINDTTKQETMAVLDGNNFTASLAAGYTYTAVLTDAVGYGFTVDSRIVTTTDAEALTGKSNVSLVIEPKETYTYSGKITGFADGYDVSKLVVTMVPPADSTLLAVDMTIDADLNFTATLEPDSDYTIQIAGVNDYEVKSELVINKNANYNADIQVGLKPMYKVSGGFTGLGDGVTVSALSFVNVDDKYTYTADVTADGYSISLRDGAYQAKATVNGYSTITHVVVDGASVEKDVMFASTSATPSMTWASDIYVGYPEKANNYETVRDAVAACAAMNPTSEAQRITVHIAPGTYREQVIVTTPYVSFVNDTDEEVLLTWYYGIGYKYYSADSTGYYNPENAYDKYEKKIASDWGTTVYVKPSATAFRAEGITFENSFNRYITDEELADGVEATGETITVERNYGLDVQSKAATERAAAIVIKADKAEFKDCSFLSSQDTVFTGNAAYNVYFKNCFIEGQTDYIYGDGNAIFDACELSFKGYSANSQGGYITAARPTSVNGYLFRNCVVTGNDKLTVTPGYFGRPWGADAKVMFVNTRLESADIITAAGWYDMSGAAPENANMYEFNTTDMSGNAIDTSSRRGKVADAATAATWTREYFFGDWVPAFYVEEDANVAFATAPFVTDNGDINTPYPGHKLTVGYSLGTANDANDASRIDWYRIKDGNEVLAKTSYASVDKTYKIATEDIGYQIKVVVTPMTVSGSVGEAASYVVPEEVRDGYDDPDASGSDAVLGDGVNIFLIGDSTVKDYSASGIWSGGKARNEGAWGEYFQSFFDNEKVTVVNYANGGRSARNFINEGSLDLVAEKISEGDYMFIQFGHNDCSNGAGYLADRYVPLGEPDANGVYPTTAGTKVTTPAELSNSGYGDKCYTYDCGGTYKWYLLQYIEVAKNAGAIPVLVTPVSRMYYNSDGTIKAHHDSTDTTTGTQVTSNNAYVTAVRQLAEEQDVILVDGFELTKELFEDAYVAGGNNVYGTQIMHTGDKTHNNKLGGMMEAAAIASTIQNMELNISYAMKAPAKVLGATTDGKTVFSVNGSGVLTAYDINSDYAERATYWENVGQAMFDAIADKAEELASKDSEDAPSEDKPSEDTPSEDKPSVDKPSEDTPSEDKPSVDVPSQNTPSVDEDSDDGEDSDDNEEEATTDVASGETAGSQSAGNTTSAVIEQKPVTMRPQTSTSETQKTPTKTEDKTAVVVPETITEPKEEVKPVQTVVSEINEQVDADHLLETAESVEAGEIVKVKVNAKEVAVTKDVFKLAAQKDIELVFDCGDYEWQFTELTDEDATELKSLAVDTNAEVKAIEEVLIKNKVAKENRRTVSFAHDGKLPGKAKVTISVADQFADGKELFFYYFNEGSNGFELISKNVVENGKIVVELTHCSDYILSEEELPAEVMTVATVTTPEAGNNIMLIVVLAIIVFMASMFAGYMLSKSKSRTSN